MRNKMRIVTGSLGLALAITALSGCQTYFGGMTLPSGHYLNHRPTYTPPDPAFPLQREVDSMQDPDGLLRRAPGTGGAPAGPAVRVDVPGAPAPAAPGK